MAHSEHIEPHAPGGHIEPPHHEVHSPFDRRVAMTMAIVAALLAAVTMLSHRAHTETLRLQAEANRLQTEADIDHTKASDQWSYYQAKKNRQYLYEACADLLTVLVPSPGTSKRANPQAAERLGSWKAKTNQYNDDAEEIQKKARDLEKKGEQRQEEAGELLKESGDVHHRAGRFDVGELGLELALVLCSLAVLTKRLGFWYGGIVAALLGAGVAATAFFVH